MEWIVVLTIVRLTVPLLIFRFSLLGILLAILVDVYDWLILQPSGTNEYNFYQKWDKSMDLYMFTIAFITSLKWKELIARKLSVVIYSVRAAGDLLFFLTGYQAILLFTPNIFETFFLFYLFFLKLSGNKQLFTSSFRVTAVLAVILIPKIIHEYLLHVMKVQPWDLFSIGELFGASGLVLSYIDYLGWGLIIHLLQLITLFYFVNKSRIS